MNYYTEVPPLPHHPTLSLTDNWERYFVFSSFATFKTSVAHDKD